MITERLYAPSARTDILSELHSLERAVAAELEDLSAEIADVQPLIDKLLSEAPDSIEIRAIACTLHAFYNGVERTFVLISKHFGEKTPSSHVWHRELLIQMSQATEDRPAVITAELCADLKQLLAFRHFYRHAYPMRLRWDRVEPLVTKLSHVPKMFVREIRGFLSGIRR